MQPPHKTDWHVVVPVKGGHDAKSRLRLSLDDDSLIAAIVHDTLDVVSQVVTPARLVIVTGDPAESARARDAGFFVVLDPGEGLNAACTAGVSAVRSAPSVRHDGPVPVAILLGDHPALTPGELVAALGAGADHETFFVPDADGLGTALLGTTTAGAPDLAFGPGSAASHSALGHTRLDLDLPGLRHDVDDEQSLRHVLAHLTLGARTRRALGR